MDTLTAQLPAGTPRAPAPLTALLRRTPTWMRWGALLVLAYPMLVLRYGGNLPAPWGALCFVAKLAVEGAALWWAAGRAGLPARMRTCLRVLAGTSCFSCLATVALEVPDWSHVGLSAEVAWASKVSVLISYSAYLIGFALYPRARKPRSSRTVLWLDMGTTLVGLGALQWSFVTWPLLTTLEGAARVAMVVYSLAFVTTSAALNLVVVWGRRLPTRRAFWWLVAGLAMYLPVAFLAQLETAGHVPHLWTSIAYFWGVVPTLVASVAIRHDPLRSDGGLPAPKATGLFNPLPLWVLVALGVSIGVSATMGEASRTFVASLALLAVTLLLGARVFLTARDHARLLRAEAAIEQRTAAARAEAVGQLAGGIAHEFNNLMMAILGNVELARQGAPAGAHEELDVIDASAHRAAGLTLKLLQFSGRQFQMARRIDLAALLRALEPALRSTVPPGAALTLSACDGATVQADPDQLRQLVHELVTNAVAALEGPGTVTVSLAREAEIPAGARTVLALRPGPSVSLCVRDTGRGMDRATMERMFQPFFSTSSPRAAGLGLAAVYGIVAAHGGGIAVESRVGEGTAVWVHLPHADSAGA